MHGETLKIIRPT